MEFLLEGDRAKEIVRERVRERDEASGKKRTPTRELILKLRKVLQNFPTVAQYHQIIAISLYYIHRPLFHHQRTRSRKRKTTNIHKVCSTSIRSEASPASASANAI